MESGEERLDDSPEGGAIAVGSPAVGKLEDAGFVAGRSKGALSGRGAPKVAIAGGEATPTCELIVVLVLGCAANGLGSEIGGTSVAGETVAGETVAGETGAGASGGATRAGGASGVVLVVVVLVVSSGIAESDGVKSLAFGILLSGRFVRILDALNRGGSVSDLVGGNEGGSSKTTGTVWEARLAP
jgi:hypothetical protein